MMLRVSTPCHRLVRWIARLGLVLLSLSSGFIVFADIASSAAPVRDAMRLLNGNCLACHNAEKHKGGLQMQSREALLRGSESGPVLNDSAPEESLLLKVLAADADPHMPPKKQLSTNQVALLSRWLKAGAPWDAEALAKASAPRQVNLSGLPPAYRPVMALALAPDGKRLAVGRQRDLVIYDLSATNYPVLARVQAHGEIVRALAWSPEGDALASGSFRELRVWNVTSKSIQPRWTVSSNLLGRVNVLRFTPHGGALVAADGAVAENGWVRVYATPTGAIISAWETDSDVIYDLAISPDGGVVATASGDRLVKFWELISRKEVGQIEAHFGAVWGAAFSTNAAELITVGGDKQLKLWDVKARESVVTIPRKRNFINVVWSADGKTVVACDDDGQLVRFKDFKRHTGEQSSETANEKELGHWAEPLHSLAVSADATRIAAGGEDGVVYLVDAEGKLLQKFEPQPPAASSGTVSFVHDVLPMMAKAGCMAGGCHAKPEGQNGFKLSVFSFDPKSDYAEIVKEARGRRVFPACPEESLLLLKPALQIDHGGGQRIEPGSETYRTLVEWIRGGMPYQRPGEPTLARIAVEPAQATYTPNEAKQLRVHAFYSDGAERDVTSLADFISNDKEIARVDGDGKVQVGTVQGEGVIIARFMGFVDASRVTVPAKQTLPDERYAALPVNNYIDRLASAQFRRLGLFPSELCTDAEFIRRSALDTIGVLPAPDEVRSFLAESIGGKRSRWIEHLLQHPAYADFWANKWTDLLRPNPDRVGIKSIFFLDQWVRDSFRANKPYDQFVREIVTGEGSNHQPGPMTVYRDRREPQDLTTMFSQLFLGVRMECAKCHHHPNEKWSQDDFYQLAAYFGPLKQKGAGLSPPISAGNETFYFAAGGAVKHPVTDAVMKPRALDAAAPEPDDATIDPRKRLADWMTNPQNPFFAKAAVNRVWAAFFGRGLVDPVDDFRISNPASNEPLLNALALDFVQHGYDLKHLMRTILNSRLYQLSSLPNEFNLPDTRNYSRSYRRRLSAEVLLDAVNDVTGTEEEFNGCPPGTRAIQTWSYKVRSHFMDAFGRPNSSSDCPCERDARSSVVQSLHMMNAGTLQAKLANPEGRVKKLADSNLSAEEVVAQLYYLALSRPPTAEECETAAAAFTAPKSTRQTATEDVLWALLNSPEFLFNH